MLFTFPFESLSFDTTAKGNSTRHPTWVSARQVKSDWQPFVMELCHRQSSSCKLPVLLMTTNDSENPLRSTDCWEQAVVAMRSDTNTDTGLKVEGQANHQHLVTFWRPKIKFWAGKYFIWPLEHWLRGITWRKNVCQHFLYVCVVQCG